MNPNFGSDMDATCGAGRSTTPVPLLPMGTIRDKKKNFLVFYTARMRLILWLRYLPASQTNHISEQ